MDMTFLVVADNTVWMARPDLQPMNTGLSVDAWLRRPVPRAVGLVGSASNAALLLVLYNRFRRGAVTTLKLCSPLLPPDHRPVEDPTAHLLELAAVGDVASTGGWHTATEADCMTYSLLIHRDAALRGNWENWNRLVKQHPLYGHLEFLSRLDTAAAGMVLAEIVDPRWWVHPSDPGSEQAVLRHFGLAGPIGVRDAATQRRQAALEQMWCQQPESLHEPGAFAHRYLSAFTSMETGLRRTNTLVLRYVLAGWRALVSLTHRNRLFVPEEFLDATALEAYRARV